MKLQPPPFPAEKSKPSTRTVSFKHSLQHHVFEQPRAATKPPLHAPQPMTSAKVAVSATTVAKAAARGRVEGEAQRLEVTRRAHHVQAHDQAQARTEDVDMGDQVITERIVAFVTNTEAAPPPLPQAIRASGERHDAPLSRETRVMRAIHALELIEQIETFVVSQRPALALTLNNSLGARVEIERVAPKQIALKVVGHNGPPTPEVLSLLREELQLRGLRVAALSVA